MVNLPLLEQGLIKSTKNPITNAHVLNLFWDIYAAVLQIFVNFKHCAFPKESHRLITRTRGSFWYFYFLVAATSSLHPPLLVSLHHARAWVKGHTQGLSLAEIKKKKEKEKKINFNPPKMKPLMCAVTKVPKVILQENMMVSSITALRYC